VAGVDQVSPIRSATPIDRLPVGPAPCCHAATARPSGLNVTATSGTSPGASGGAGRMVWGASQTSCPGASDRETTMPSVDS
jgi:hypothetical protein